MPDPNDYMNPGGNSQNSVEQQFLAQQQDMQGLQQQPQQKPEEGAEYAQIASLITDLDRRLRVLEERYSNLRKKLQLTDQNLLESERSFAKELRTINDDSTEMKRRMNEFSEKTGMFANELGNVAQKRDLKVIEKYFNMWSPENFVTRNELREYLKNKKVRLLSSQEDSQDQ